MLVFSFAKLSFSCSQLQAFRDEDRRKAKIRESPIVIFAFAASNKSFTDPIIKLLDYQTIFAVMKNRAFERYRSAE